MEADRLGYSKGVIVILDANTLIYMAEGLIPPSLIGEVVELNYKMVTPLEVVRELEKLKSTPRMTKIKRLASRALELLETLGIDVVYAGVSGGDADDAIENLALKLRDQGLRVVVATSDRALRRRIRNHGIPTIYYRRSRGAPEIEWSPI